ncbi:MAG: glycine--tRNA ligase [Thermoplasmata archaeon]|nr:glycine--tRNA ligase [Thermoplasmata archaeon]
MNADELYAICRRRGFLWQSAEIYSSISGFYDYGHLGAALKRNWENLWLRFFLSLNDNYHLIDTPTIMPEAALKASGHVDLFTDYLVTCRNCSQPYRADALIEETAGIEAESLNASELDAKITELKIKCPRCGQANFTEAKPFNMMFPVSIGATGKDRGFLRPETAQGAYLNFNREFETCRRKLPLGLAIIGRAYRNEISPRQGLYRLRELIQAELQIFFDPEKFNQQYRCRDEPEKLSVVLVSHRPELRHYTAAELLGLGMPEFYVYHMLRIQKFYTVTLGVPLQKFRFFEKSEKERAFYNRIHFDVEVEMESLGGFKEVAGLHYRGDYDLTRHQTMSKVSHEVNIDGRKFVPHVLELSFGVDRNIWALLDLFMVRENERNLLKLKPYLAPYHCGVFPLFKRDGLDKVALEISESLKNEFRVFYDDSGSIGRRYARMDEIGTPFCITVDYDTVQEGQLKDTVTVRFRDTAQQERVQIPQLHKYLGRFLLPS